MYNLKEFADMITDRVRMDAYAEALKRTVKPGSVVVDIGTGTGIFAFIACQLGASKVYAIEANPLIELAKPMAAANGFSDRIVFIQDYSTKIDLPERADVIVGDLRGRLPYKIPNILTYYDAKNRLLKPDGILIPKCDRLYATFISNPSAYSRLVAQPWIENPYQLDMRAALPLTVNTPIQRMNVTPEQMLLPAQLWDTIEYGTRDSPRGIGSLTWQVETAGRADFVALWFDAELVEGVGFSGNPLVEPGLQVYGSTYLPLQEPLDLEPGQVVTLDIGANIIGQRYTYHWQTGLYASVEARTKRTPLKRFDQSTLFGDLLPNLTKRTYGYKPKLRLNGKVHLFILEQMQNGDATLEEIAAAAQKAFPGLSQDVDTVIEEVANLAEQFSE